MTRPLRVLLMHPGAAWSTADVEAGLRYGLEQHGVEVVRYRLDTRYEGAKRWLYQSWRTAFKSNPEIPRPTATDAVYQASVDAIPWALRHRVDVVLAVSAMIVHPDVLIMMRRAGLRVVVLFTETPYDLDKELKIASLVDGCWTNERSCVHDFEQVNPNAGYLPHAWHPNRHYLSGRSVADLPSHDVVFVGSGFKERIAWFNAIDWTGIDLGLYGSWKGLGLKKSLRRCVKNGPIHNETAAALYRRAKIGLNLYRQNKGWGNDAPPLDRIAESLSPRAYELAACGSFHLSEHRAEVSEVFGSLIPTFSTPAEAEGLIRQWLADPDGRARIAAHLPACVAESSWTERAARVIGDLQTLLGIPVAA